MPRPTASLDPGLSRADILAWLREDDSARLERLWAAADVTRRRHVGDEVHLRGLIEITNHCVRACGYCGLRAANRAIERYRMSADEILGCARDAEACGYGTVVLQSGRGLRPQDRDWIAGVVRRIKARDRRSPSRSASASGRRQDLAAWREAGADRYLLRFETSDDELYKLIHPDPAAAARQRPHGHAAHAAAARLRGRQRHHGRHPRPDVRRAWPTTSSCSARLDLDMIGIGPYIPHPLTPLGDRGSWARRDPAGRADPGRRAHRVQGRSPSRRLVCPEANIPSTTALATINKVDGRELGLQRGANIVMPNLTPPRVPRALRDLPGQGLRQRDGRDVPRLPDGPHRVHRPRDRQRPRRPQAPGTLTSGVAASGSGQTGDRGCASPPGVSCLRM